MGQYKRVAHAGKISGMNDIALEKAQLRSKILASRASRSKSASDELALTANLTNLFLQIYPKRVAIYLSFGTEPSTELFIEYLLLKGIEVIVPKVINQHELAWYQYTGIGAKASSLGIPEPDEVLHQQTTLEDVELLFIPALAIDRVGNRLGRGKGYFDKELAKVKDIEVFAICFESEFLDAIPAEAHDRKVTGVVTELGIHELN